MSTLKDKNCVVTGAARGLGLTYALRLASLGANVAVSDIDLKSASQYEAERSRLVDGDLTATVGQYGGKVITHQHDASDPAGVQSFADVVRSEWGGIDILVCNAGGGSAVGSSSPTTLDLDAARTTFDRNLFTVMSTVKSFVPLMDGRPGGAIVNIASYAGTRAQPGGNAADYGAAKAGVAHFTRSLAMELAAKGIRANALAPGLIGTGQWNARFGNDDPDTLAKYAKQVPMGRLGTPEDCAGVVEFLVTPLSGYVTGQVIPVDGGLVSWAN